MDIQKLVDGIEALLELMFGGKPPEWLLPVIAWILACGIILLGLTFLVAQLKKIWFEFIQPVFYNPDEKMRRLRRKRFSDYLESEIKRLNLFESWHDYRFTELEAEVEAEGRVFIFGQYGIPWINRSGVRHEKSLSKALQRSNERLILLEGEPGSGKSVALRHIALLLSSKASKSKNVKSTIPIYVNLKNLQRNTDEIIDRNLIESFVLKTINRVKDRDVDEFLETEFSEGNRNGTWLFLFDSFDEIPEILSSIEADSTIQKYAEAISDFLGGMNKCRGIIASREYRGPRVLGWSRFRILPLSYSQRVRLIKLTGLPREKTWQMIGELNQITTDFSAIASNPLFLALLCDFLRRSESNNIPHHTHEVFREYFNKRLDEDSERVQRRFGISIQEVKSGMERIAFCMTAESSIGLNPSRHNISDVTAKYYDDLPERKLNQLLDILEFLKLARSEDDSFIDGSKRFAFAHRRFQEYFTTSFLLQGIQKISPSELLSNASWRETTVVLFQTQNPNNLIPLLEEAEQVLRINYDTALSTLTERENLQTIQYEENNNSLNRLHRSFIIFRDRVMEALFKFIGLFDDFSPSNRKQEERIRLPFAWPQGSQHLLSILQDGFVARQHIPSSLQQAADSLLECIYWQGILLDRKLSLEIAGIASEPVLLDMLINAFNSKSRLLKHTAYRQINRLSAVPKSISSHIHKEIVQIAKSRKLWIQRFEAKAHVNRISDSKEYIHTINLMLWALPIDSTITFVSVIIVFQSSGLSEFLTASVISASLIFLYLLRWFIKLEEWNILPLFVLSLFGFFFAISQFQWWALLIFFVGVWGWGAFFIAETGKFTLPIWWLFYPVIALIKIAKFIIGISILIIVAIPFAMLELLLNIPSKFVRTIRSISEIKKFILSLLALALTYLILLSSFWLSSYLVAIGAPNYLALAPILLLIFSSRIIDIRNFVRDVISERRWMSKRHSSITVEGFVILIGGIKHHEIRARLIKIVRIKQLLPVTQDVVIHLGHLVLVAENLVGMGPAARLKNFPSVLSLIKKSDPEMAGLLVENGERAWKFITRWDQVDLDELCILLEQYKLQVSLHN